MRLVIYRHHPQDAPEAAWGHPCVNKIIRFRTPLIEPLAVHQMIPGWLRRIEQIAIRVMFVLLAPRIAPIIENLTSEQVPADAPGMTISIRHHDPLPHLYRVEIYDLEGYMIDLGFKPHCDEKRVMVRRLVASIQPHERAHRRAVGQAHHIGRYEAERVDVRAHTSIEIHRLQYEVPQPWWPAVVRASAAECR